MNKHRLFRFIMVSCVTIVIGLSAIGAEFYARRYERNRTDPPDYFPSIYYPHRRLRYGLVPNLDYFGWFRINSLGFRGREFDSKKQPAAFRIVCLGGSTTFDVGTVGPDKPWPEILEDELRHRFGASNVEVLNLGIGGATSLDSLIDFQMRAIDLEPDLVIVYQTHNDFSYSIPSPRRQPTGLFPLEDAPRSRFTRWITYNSLLYAKTQGRVVQRLSSIGTGILSVVGLGNTGEPGEDRDAAMLAGLKNFELNMRSIAAIARANGIRLILPEVILPFSGAAKEGCIACERAMSELYGGIESETLRDILGRYDQVLASLGASESGVDYIQTEGFVPSEDRYYNDPVHFGPEGSRLMGVKLAETLAPIIREMQAKIAN